jgi:hypothetical protein
VLPSFLADAAWGGHKPARRHECLHGQFFLDYAEDLRRVLKAGDLSQKTEPEGPHNTTAVLSAKGVYHKSRENA